MRPTDIISSVLLFAAVSTAWPWPPGWQPLEVAKREIAPFVEKRATTTKFNLSATFKQGNTATTKKKSSKGSGKTTGKAGITTSTASGSNAKTTAKGAATHKSSGKQTEYKTTKTFDARKPAGGISMITPNALGGAQYYKIKDYVTFAWNYTSLSITPSAVDILASCSLNSATYTIALNQSITAATQSITWDTGEFQKTASTPLVIATYTLVVYDASSEITASPRAGYLGLYDQFTFGMYTPQKYTPMADYVCATCNGAMSSMERQTLAFLFGTVAITVLSFGWFAGVAGLW